MILTSILGHYFRAHRPMWASQPLSGEGAAKKGGRLNRAGVPALYLAQSPETAIAEYLQLSSLMPPFTLVSYEVSLTSVVDFRRGYDPESFDPLWQDLMCNWRKLAFLDGIEPPSWVLGDMVLHAGHSGVLFPSTKHFEGVNLVVFSQNLKAGDRVREFDPDLELPKDRSSWR